MKGSISKKKRKEKKNPTTNGWEKVGKAAKTPRTQTSLSTGGCLICGNWSAICFLKGIYKSLFTIVQILFLPCIMCIQRKNTFFVANCQLWTTVSGKGDGNSEVPNQLLETTVQQGHRQNWRGIGLFVMKLNTAEDYQNCLKLMFPFMVISRHLSMLCLKWLCYLTDLLIVIFVKQRVVFPLALTASFPWSTIATTIPLLATSNAKLFLLSKWPMFFYRQSFQLTSNLFQWYFPDLSWG